MQISLASQLDQSPIIIDYTTPASTPPPRHCLTYCYSMKAVCSAPEERITITRIVNISQKSSRLLRAIVTTHSKHLLAIMVKAVISDLVSVSDGLGSWKRYQYAKYAVMMSRPN
ncbi:hypothetical protein LSH36_837g00008 [Paralvinella palmiformis]|uniref:Uncharacterized protein n=1 Tax=Paralvinella palmiformis TaxID=53620 RepID=A0AAD9IZJ8_9ANNE|nr:hypothetical protein LSH36_837g00008 [Paralvinella palmiformis]